MIERQDGHIVIELINQRSEVQILPPQLTEANERSPAKVAFLVSVTNLGS